MTPDFTSSASRRPSVAPGAAVALGFLAYGLILWLSFRLPRTVDGGIPELALFMAASLQSVPFVLLAQLAYLGDRVPVGRVLTFVVWLLFAGGAAAGLLLLTLGPLADPERLAQFRDPKVRAELGLEFIEVFKSGGFPAFRGALLALLLGTVAGAFCFTRWARESAARLSPLDPESWVHATALAVVVAGTVNLFVPLVTLGAPPITEFTKADAGVDPQRLTLYAFAWLLPATVLAVGVPFGRGFRSGLTRLGLVRPTLLQISNAVAGATLLAFAVPWLELLIGAVWRRFGWPTTDENAMSELTKAFVTPLGAVIIAVTAGLGEELAVRGVLQPRLGVVLSNLFFTALHALQYNGDGLLVVFLLGLILGVVRKWTNTTTSAILHGTYDFLLVAALIPRPNFSP